MEKVYKLTNREQENAVKPVFAIIILLAISVGSVSANTQGYVGFGNWKVLDTKPDPFDPEKHYEVAFLAAMSNSNFGLVVYCSRNAVIPDELHIMFSPEHTTTDSYVGFVDVVFEKGKPRTLKVWIERGSKSWHPSSKDQPWLKSGLQSSDRMYARWEQQGGRQVTAEFDLNGGKEAIAEIKRRCASPSS